MGVNKKQDATSLRKPFVGFPSKKEMSIKLAQFLWNCWQRVGDTTFREPGESDQGWMLQSKRKQKGARSQRWGMGVRNTWQKAKVLKGERWQHVPQLHWVNWGPSVDLKHWPSFTVCVRMFFHDSNNKSWRKHGSDRKIFFKKHLW